MHLTTDTPFAVLLLGFALGIRHALDVDHLAAVATIVTRGPTTRAASAIGAIWGLGHTVALLVVASVVLVFQTALPPALVHAFEVGVAGMLVVLGVNVLWRLWRGATMHVHTHFHGGRPHVHVHLHRDAAHDHPAPHHHHAVAATRRPFMVGVAHGLAGSGGLMLAVLATIPDRLVGFAYVAAFGIGSIGGMTAMTTLLGVPLRAAGTRHHRAIEAGAAGASVIVGLAMAWHLGSGW